MFGDLTEVIQDVKLDTDHDSRPEQNLADYELRAELVRLFSKMDAIREGMIAHIEVRAGIPRRIAVKASSLMDS
jgi:hypothetical protein